MRPVFSDNLSWCGVVGLLILNFGVLDLRVTDILREMVTREEFERLRRKGFKERVARLTAALEMPVEIAARIERLRGLRNHIAHAYLNTNLATGEQTLIVPRDVDELPEDQLRRMTFEELMTAGQDVADLVEFLS